jgi:hypothetical protein
MPHLHADRVVTFAVAPHISGVARSIAMKVHLSLLQNATRILSLFGAAGTAASAAEFGRQPRRGTLETLGIDPEHYRRIGR